MRFRYLTIALALLVVFASDSLGQSQQPPQTQRVQTDQQFDSARASKDKAEEPAAQTNKSQPIAPEVKPPELKKETSNHDIHGAEEASEYWPFLIFGTRLKITDSLLALFTFLLVAIGAWQGFQLQRTVTLARNEFVATHRPKIKIHAVEATRREVADQNFIGASILAFNVGESVAKNVEVRGQLFMGPNFQVDVQRRLVKQFDEVLSGQKLRAEITSDVHAAYAASGKRTGVICYCLGWIAYWDENGQRRETGFCFQPEFSNEGDRWVSAKKPEFEYEY